MKKNLISVLILALVLVNLIMTVILMITVLPQTQKANELITKVCSAIDLELENGTDSVLNQPEVPIADIVSYDIVDSMTINLKKDTDGETHIAIITVTITMNSKDDDYKEYGETIADNESLIKSTINSVVSDFTYDEFIGDQQAVRNEIVKELQAMYDSQFIIGVGFSTVTCQ